MKDFLLLLEMKDSIYKLFKSRERISKSFKENFFQSQISTQHLRNLRSRPAVLASCPLEEGLRMVCPQSLEIWPRVICRQLMKQALEYHYQHLCYLRPRPLLYVHHAPSKKGCPVF